MLRRIIILTFSFLILIGLPAYAQTVDEVIEKNVKARGGLEKLKALKSIKVTGKIMMQGMEAPLTLQVKRPNSLRMEMTLQGKTMVQGFDGTTGWHIMPFMGSPDPEKSSEQETNDFRDQADVEGPLVNYKEKGNKVELIGKEEMEGTPVYKLKLTMKSGDVRYVYLDSKSFLELKMTAKRKNQGNEIEVESYFSDYKPVNGIMMAHAVENKVKGQTVAQMTFSKVELDATIDDAIFKMPAKSPDKQPAKP